jgi:methylenetetrahydrofolate dehydrogenase (NADP+)/methenyltetrahydrofolate cyclohydrolase
MIFDGRKFAKVIEERVRQRVAKMEIKPRIASILVGTDPASELYTRLKSEAAQRCLMEFQVHRLKEREEIAKLVNGLSESVDGIMIQLPVPGLTGQALYDALSMIPIHKDVDGLRWVESGIKPATVAAVLSIVEEIKQVHDPLIWERKFVVLGSRGAVGRPLCHFLRERGVGVREIEWDTPNPADLTRQGEVIISCTGQGGLITEEMIKEGSVVIDVGMSKNESGKIVGDMTPLVYQKASLAVPVPGGVGPVTIACLLQNVLELRGQR